ncbi:MAG: ABC transporter substrate-binding protein [Ardenticatenia bacterium]|nr:MAG: ABC transporter substrate-binding protein [Ardenticatenia bacterium]
MSTRMFRIFSALLAVAMLLGLVVPVAHAQGPCQGSSSQCAVEAAKQFAGTTINYVREAGLQAQDPLTMAPIWEELTGIKVNVIELAYLDMYTKPLQDHLTGGGAYDAIDLSPMWMQDYVNAGALEPLDPYIEKYMNPADMEDFLPVYRSEGVMKINGVTYGLYDDGDVFILYYRKDLFEDETNKAEFKAKYGYELTPPETEQQMYDAAEFFTNKYAPELYGLAMQRMEGQAYSWFVGPFSGRGGQFFDENMKATINSEIGVQLLTDMVKQNKVMPPGVEKWGFMEVLSAWMDGKVAMIVTWPPIGRWSAGYGDTAKQLAWVPASKVVGKVGYMPQPGGRPTLAGGFNMCISASSNNKEAAYLFIQWMTSPDISLQRVMLPFALRDPYRLSHFNSPLYRSAWPEAGEYLDTLKKAAMAGQYELGIPGAREYMEAIDNALTAAYAGKDPKEALDEAAAKWDAITERLGVENQKKAYEQWLKNPWNRLGPKVEVPAE